MTRYIWIVVGNIAAHDGHVVRMEADDGWCSDNPGGWTYQEVCGSHGTVLGEFDTEEEARELLREFLKCDAPETGAYCYTHNREGR